MPVEAEPRVTGSLDKELIRGVIRDHLSQVRYCYEKALVRSPGLFGKVNTVWTIGADGRVRDAKVDSTTMAHPEVSSCITSKILTWSFPRPRGGGTVVVRYPFIFTTTG